MKIKEFLKEINGVFIPPKRIIHFGKQKYGAPYFWPMGYVDTIFKLRVRKASDKDIRPLVRRFKNRLFKNVLGYDIWIGMGWPIKVKTIDLGWKDKFDSPRFEWSPAFQINFFGLQYHTSLQASDTYWEMFLQWRYYHDKDIEKTEKKWGWRDSRTKKSTWKKEYLVGSTAKKQDMIKKFINYGSSNTHRK